MPAYSHQELMVYALNHVQYAASQLRGDEG